MKKSENFVLRVGGSDRVWRKWYKIPIEPKLSFVTFPQKKKNRKWKRFELNWVGAGAPPVKIDSNE